MKNREIKFRICYTDQMGGKLLIYSSDKHLVTLSGMVLENYGKSFKEPFWENVFDAGEEPVLQQFTGLLDKNGREIYEGDLLSFAVKGAAHGREREEYENQEVYYDEELACFMFGKNYTNAGNFWSHCMLDAIDKETLEVVGNIFEGTAK